MGVDVDELIKERERETNKQTIWCHHKVATASSGDSSRARVIYLLTYLGICFDLLTVMYCICRVISKLLCIKEKKQMVALGVNNKKR